MQTYDEPLLEQVAPFKHGLLKHALTTLKNLNYNTNFIIKNIFICYIFDN